MPFLFSHGVAPFKMQYAAKRHISLHSQAQETHHLFTNWKQIMQRWEERFGDTLEKPKDLAN